MSQRMHRWIIDSIEEEVAAVEEDGSRLIHLPTWMLPNDIREGDILHVERKEDASGAVELRVQPDPAATAEARRRSAEQVRSVPQPHDPGGDIVL